MVTVGTVGVFGVVGSTVSVNMRVVLGLEIAPKRRVVKSLLMVVGTDLIWCLGVCACVCMCVFVYVCVIVCNHI